MNVEENQFLERVSSYGIQALYYIRVVSKEKDFSLLECVWEFK